MPKIVITLDFTIRVWIYSVCFLSALTNIVIFLDYAYTLSHYTNNFIEIVYDIYVYHRIKSVLILVGFCILFMLGAMIAAIVNRDKDFRLQGRYGWTQFVIGLVILLLYFFYDKEVLFLLFFSMAFGIQNGLIRSYKGMGFKTTHVTGSLSDMGTYLAYYIRGEKDSSWKIVFQFMLLVSFFSGTFVGIVMHTYLKHSMLMIAGILYILSGLFFFLLRFIDKVTHQQLITTTPVDATASNNSSPPH